MMLMLPAAARMRHKQEFTLVMRRGRRAGRALLSAHLVIREERPGEAKVGFVVSRAVGTAVVRNRVRRRLRHLMRERTGYLPEGSLLVIRANPAAADARHRDLAAELDLVLGKLLRRQVGALGGR
jgi:ribonuclease P protein component